MGELMPGIPSLPGDETTWAAFTDQFETLKKGDKPISLTNWDDTDTQPAVAAGSALEIAGATYRFPSEAIIQSESGTASGVVYVVVKTNDPDANSATAYFTNTAPEWRDDLNGWYDTTGANRYTGHLMDWDGASAYSKKRVFSVQAKGGEVFTVGAGGDLISGDINADDISGATGEFSGGISGSTGTFSGLIDAPEYALSGSVPITKIAVTSFPHAFPKGTIIPLIAHVNNLSSISLEVYASGGWEIFADYDEGSTMDVACNVGTLLTDGTTFRVNRYRGDSATFDYAIVGA